MATAVLYNSTGTFGLTTSYLTNYVTGSIYLTFMIYVVLLFVLLLSFRVPFQYAAIMIFMPLVVLTAYVGDWFTFTGMLILFFAAVVAKRLTE